MSTAQDILGGFAIAQPAPARRKWTIALVCGFGALLTIALTVAVALAVRARLRPSPPAYDTAAISVGDLRASVTEHGTLHSVNTVEVGAEVSGKVLKVYVAANDRVTRGQLLAEIDREQLKGALDEARAQLTVAGATYQQTIVTVEETRLALARAKSLLAASLGTQRDLEAAQAAAARARAQAQSAAASVEVARAAVRQATWRLERTRIVSPIDGVVLARMIEPGQTVAASFQAPVLFKLAEDLDTLALHVDIDEADVARVRGGEEATFVVNAYPGRAFASRVLSVRNEPKVTRDVVSYEAVLAVDNHERLLRPGMTATATITTGSRSGVLLVPNAALRFSPDDVAQKESAPRVYVSSGGSLKPVPVTRGLSDEQRTEVTSDGLRAGDSVVVGVRDTE